MAEQKYRQSRYADKEIKSRYSDKKRGRGGTKKKSRRDADPEITPERVIRQRRKKLANRAEMHSFLFRLLCMAAILALLFGLVFGIAPVADDSMKPVLSPGDLVLYYRLENSLISQDVVVFEQDRRQYIGRVVAREGDTVEITEDSQLRINGSTVAETNIYFSTPRYDTGVEYPLTLGQDEYFILCDHRTSGKDSRYFGAITGKDIKGILIAAVRRPGL